MRLSLISFISKKISGGKNGFLGYAYIVAFISVALGTIALLLSLSVLKGFEKKLFETAVSFTSHITVNTFDRTPIADYDIKIDKINRISEVISASPVIMREGLYRSNGNIDGIAIKGIQKPYFKQYLASFTSLDASAFDNLAENEILIGKSVAEKLGLAKGSEIIVYALDTDNPATSMPRVRKFKIAGLYHSGMEQFDASIFLMKFDHAAKFLKLPIGSTSNIEVSVADPSAAGSIAEKIDVTIGYPHYSTTVFDKFGHIFNWIEFQKEPIPIVLGIISIVAVLNIVTALLIAVVEKTKTIGILRALGLPDSYVTSVFVFMGMRIALLGNLIGVAIALGFSVLQSQYSLIKLNPEIYYLDELPIEIELSSYLLVITVSLLLAFLASYMPSKLNSSKSVLSVISFK